MIAGAISCFVRYRRAPADGGLTSLPLQALRLTASRIGWPVKRPLGSEAVPQPNGAMRTIVIPATVTLAMVGAATAALYASSGLLAAVNLVSIIYLVPVVIAALRWGIWPGLLAAIAGALAADFFFYPPLYSFWIGDTQHIADLLIFLIIALVIGKLAGDLRERERELNDLYGYSRQLAACFTTPDLIAATRDYLSKCLGRPTVLLEKASLDEDSPVTAGVPKAVRRKAQSAIAGNGAAAHTIFDGATRHIWLARAVSLGDMRYVVFADLGTSVMDTKRRLNRRIDDVLAEAADNIARLDLARAIEEFRIQAHADTLKSALVMTMSHELRTPLVSILGAASVLDQMTEIRKDARARSLVEAVHDEAARLDGILKILSMPPALPPRSRDRARN